MIWEERSVAMGYSVGGDWGWVHHSFSEVENAGGGWRPGPRPGRAGYAVIGSPTTWPRCFVFATRSSC